MERLGAVAWTAGAVLGRAQSPQRWWRRLSHPTPATRHRGAWTYKTLRWQKPKKAGNSAKNDAENQQKMGFLDFLKCKR
jgi:hypothetical protein